METSWVRSSSQSPVHLHTYLKRLPMTHTLYVVLYVQRNVSKSKCLLLTLNMYCTLTNLKFGRTAAQLSVVVGSSARSPDTPDSDFRFLLVCHLSVLLASGWTQLAVHSRQISDFTIYDILIVTSYVTTDKTG